uniref:Allatotropin-2 n=1 Tax=Charonia tritonis TaxID=1960912 RepID=A0A1S6JPZ3_9CAEN|nr:Allatotropin-2 precursor [Charonia tritonis]
MMRTSLVLIGLVVIALGQALPTHSNSRQKRGFRINSSSRVAHGYGKRTFNTMDDSLFPSPSSNGLMTVQELAQLAAENPSLSEALIQKFIDADGDGIVSTQELFGVAVE